MNDGPILFYAKDGIIYPVAMTDEEKQMFELAVQVIAPLKVLVSQPQGTLLDLTKVK